MSQNIILQRKRREFLMITAALPAAIHALASTQPERSADFLEELVKGWNQPLQVLCAAEVEWDPGSKTAMGAYISWGMLVSLTPR